VSLPAACKSLVDAEDEHPSAYSVELQRLDRRAGTRRGYDSSMQRKGQPTVANRAHRRVDSEAHRQMTSRWGKVLFETPRTVRMTV
jgi:hypothetical protein